MLPHALVASARARAIAENRPVLVSFTERAPAFDPLTLLRAVARDSSFNGLSEDLGSGMMYWTHPSEAFTLAGIGAVATLTATGPDRFVSIDRAWRALLDGAQIGGDTGAADGPSLMGGFAFEPDGPRSTAWREFQSAHMIVPRVQLMVAGNNCSTTISFVVEPDGQPDIDLDALLELRRTILESQSQVPDEMGLTEDAAEMPVFNDSLPPEEWREIVARAVDDIRSGNLEKVVLARAVESSAQRDLDVFQLLHVLRSAHTSSFVFGYWRGESAFVGASPERLVRLDGRDVRASSLAGTARRGKTPQEDADLAKELMASGKDRAEHATVRESLRSKLAEVCDDVTAADTPALLTLPHVHHLHTGVTGKLRGGNSLLELVGRLHPTPAVGGTPRDAALAFIRANEKLDRGWYAAPIGWVGGDRGEFAVALRSGVITGSDATLFAGCGIVADSNPERELEESVLKLQPMQTAIAAALVTITSDSTIVAGSEQLQ
jgi:menaquinone-specific isochorismate synthase